MGRGNLSSSEIEQLLKNHYILSVDEKRIIYSDEFKLRFMKEYQAGKKPTQIFRDAGLDPDILGSKRIERATARWKESYAAGTLDVISRKKMDEKTSSSLERERKSSAKKLAKKDQQLGKQQQRHQKQVEELTLKHQEQLSKKQSEIDDLKAQVELLKKAGSLGRRRCANKVYGKIDLCVLVEEKHAESHGKCSISKLCKALSLPRSTYYYYLSHKSNREKREEMDLEAHFFIEKIFLSRHQRCKGSRSIKDTLELDYGILYNRKKIQRIMRKFGLKCPIKTCNPYRNMWKATKEDKIAPNLLNRAFKPGQARRVLLTDITYIKHQGHFSYLSVILDSQTGEPLAYKLSKSLKVGFAIDTLKQLSVSELAEGVLLHSDQGVHYSSKAFRSQLKKMNITQSMSRRGNCHDNAPMESFFGHMKAEMDIDSNWSFEQLQKEINNYMYDYRYIRRRRNLNRMTPYEYGSTLMSKAA